MGFERKLLVCQNRAGQGVAGEIAYQRCYGWGELATTKEKMIEGNRTRAAKILGIARSTLNEKLKQIDRQ
jgi:hypothetical protein